MKGFRFLVLSAFCFSGVSLRADTPSLSHFNIQEALKRTKLALMSCAKNRGQCELTEQEAGLVEKMATESPMNTPLIFSADSAEFILPGEVVERSAKTGSAPGDPIYINEKFVGAFDLFTAAGLLTHEIGHHHGKWTHTDLDLLGAKIRKYLLKRSFVFTSEQRSRLTVYQNYRSLEYAKEEAPEGLIYQPHMVLQRPGGEYADLWPIASKSICQDAGYRFHGTAVEEASASDMDGVFQGQFTLHSLCSIQINGFWLKIKIKHRLTLDIPTEGFDQIRARATPINTDDPLDVLFRLTRNEVKDGLWNADLELDFSFGKVPDPFPTRCQAVIWHQQLRLQDDMLFRACTVTILSRTRVRIHLEQPLGPRSLSGFYRLSRLRFLGGDGASPFELIKEFPSEVFMNWKEGSNPFPLTAQVICPRLTGDICRLETNEELVFAMGSEFRDAINGSFWICPDPPRFPMTCELLQVFQVKGPHTRLEGNRLIFPRNLMRGPQIIYDLTLVDRNFVVHRFPRKIFVQ